jgi:hypothetical protein
MKQGKLAHSIAYLIAGWLGLGISSVAKADPMAYATIGNGGNFGTVDLNTGVFTLLGNSGQSLAGLGVSNGALYGTSLQVPNGTLYNINPTNGLATSVGSSTVTYFDFGSTTTGLFALDSNFGNLNLYSINSATGAATSIGPAGLAINIAGAYFGLSTNSSSLYFSDRSELYTLNTNTGAATPIGPLGDSIQFGGLVQENGILYGGEDSPRSAAVDTVDPMTGAATPGPLLTGNGAGVMFGLAPNPVPVPARPIGRGLPVVLAVGGVLLGAKFLERKRDRRSLA